ncbi:MAG TPA: hypothetical protein VNH83_12655 [Bryobacteraceae bacterium]|nr:hypothetical protein [Bryobacteraceae bacterium]
MDIGLKPAVDALLAELKAAPPEKIAGIVASLEKALQDIDGTANAARDDLNLLQPVLVELKSTIVSVNALVIPLASALNEVRELVATYKHGVVISPVREKGDT